MACQRLQHLLVVLMIVVMVPCCMNPESGWPSPEHLHCASMRRGVVFVSCSEACFVPGVARTVRRTVCRTDSLSNEAHAHSLHQN